MWVVTSSMWDIASSLWAVTASMHDLQALCWLLHPLTLTLTITITKAQRRARNHTPTTVAAIRRRVSRHGSAQGTKTENQDRVPRRRTKTKNGELRMRNDKEGEEERKNSYPVSTFENRFPKISESLLITCVDPRDHTTFQIITIYVDDGSKTTVE